MSIQSEIDRIAGAKTTLGNYLQQNGVTVPAGASLDEMALQLADVIEKQNKIIASGILKGDGNGGVSAATPGTDYLETAPVTSVNGKTGAVVLNKSDVGLGNVDNVSINARLNRTTNVAADDANYTNYMARGEALFSYEHIPSVNGTIAWQYE